MDIFAHLLWSVALYWQHPKRWLVGFVGFMPDMISFGPHTIASIIIGTMGKPELHTIPKYVFVMYDISHSLVVYAAVAAVLWYVWRPAFWLSFGWPLHIIIDMPTHTQEFFPTPLFWPLSDFTVSGISWATGWFM